MISDLQSDRLMQPYCLTSDLASLLAMVTMYNYSNHIVLHNKLIG